MKKRLLALFLVCLLYLLPASADTALIVALSNNAGEPNQTVMLPMMFQNYTDIAGFVFQAEYDHQALKLQSISLAKPQDQPPGELSFNAETDQFSWFSDEPLTPSDGAWCYLHFAIQSDAAPGNYPVSLKLKSDDPSNLVNSLCKPLPVVFSAGSIQVEPNHWTFTSNTAPDLQNNTTDISVQVSNFDSNVAQAAIVYITAYGSSGQMLQVKAIPVYLENGLTELHVQFQCIPFEVKCLLLDRNTQIPLHESTQWFK